MNTYGGDNEPFRQLPAWAQDELSKLASDLDTVLDADKSRRSEIIYLESLVSELCSRLTDVLGSVHTDREWSQIRQQALATREKARAAIGL